jgi:hypothetical protein
MKKEKKNSNCCDSNNSEKPAGATFSNNQRVVNTATSNGCSLFSSLDEALKAHVWATANEIRQRDDETFYGMAERMCEECLSAPATTAQMQDWLYLAQRECGCQCQIVGTDWFAYRADDLGDEEVILIYSPYGADVVANLADAELLGIESEIDFPRLAPQSYKPQGGDDVQVLYYKYATERGDEKLVMAYPHVLRQL